MYVLFAERKKNKNAYPPSARKKRHVTLSYDRWRKGALPFEPL